MGSCQGIHFSTICKVYIPGHKPACLPGVALLTFMTRKFTVFSGFALIPGLRIKDEMVLDLGTSNTVITSGKQPRILREPSRILLDRALSGLPLPQKSSDAKQALASKVWVRPVESGKVVNVYAMEQLLKPLLAETSRGLRALTMRRVVGLLVSPFLNEEERSHARALLVDLGFSKIHLIEAPFAAANGAGLDVSSATGQAIVDLGGGTTKTSVFSMGGLVNWHEEPVGGRSFDHAIGEYLRARYGVDVPPGLGEKIKLSIGSLHPKDKPERFSFPGTERVSRLPRKVTLDDNEVRDVMTDTFEGFLRGIMKGLEALPPELAGDIARQGIVLVGGGALVPGMADYLQERIGLSFRMANDPMNTTVLGARAMLRNGLNSG